MLSWYDPIIGRVKYRWALGLLRWVDRYLGSVNNDEDDILFAEARKLKKQRQKEKDATTNTPAVVGKNWGRR